MYMLCLHAHCMYCLNWSINLLATWYHLKFYLVCNHTKILKTAISSKPDESIPLLHAATTILSGAEEQILPWYHSFPGSGGCTLVIDSSHRGLGDPGNNLLLEFWHLFFNSRFLTVTSDLRSTHCHI